MAGTLYLVPTPIGNLGDISRRCAETLAAVDFIAAEDTRVTLKLLNHLGLKKPLLSYYRQMCIRDRGITERHYQKIEYGHINISATMLITLADYFHVTTDYLLGREG